MGERSVRPVIAIVTAMEEYQTRLLDAAAQVLATRGLPLVVHCEGPNARGVEAPLLVSLLAEADPLGVLSMNSMDEAGHAPLLALLDRVGVPAVHLGMHLPERTCVWGDSEDAMRELMTHLLDERGARTIALVRGIAHHPDSIARERVVREELGRRRIGLDPELVVTGDFSPEPSYRGVRAILERRRDLDAVVAFNDRSALAAIDALSDMELRVPEDVAVTGFDNDDTATHWPGLTTVDQGCERQGVIAAELLLEQLDGRATPAATIVPASLIVRGSTASRGTPPVTDVATAVGMARIEKRHLAAQSGIVAMSHALDFCWTVDDIVDVLASHLPRLGVERAFLALHERAHTDDEAGLSVRVAEDRVHLVLDHRGGRTFPTSRHSYPAHELLPEHLRGQLDRGRFTLQPLAVLDRPVGFALFEQTGGSTRLAELLRIDLSRALDGVLATQEARTHAALLERIVTRRTRELRSEVETRRRAERELQAANAELQRSAMLDGLTQIANRTAFQSHLDAHWRAQAGTQQPITLLMVDVDAFKPYNDHYGHLLGDEALRTLASCLRRAARGADDLVCRYGGEEFAVVLPRSDRRAGVAVAQRFQQLLADAAIPHETSPVAPVLTASVGIAEGLPTDGCDPELLIAGADEALYRAKSLGRDRIQLAGQLVPPAVSPSPGGEVVGHDAGGVSPPTLPAPPGPARHR